MSALRIIKKIVKRILITFFALLVLFITLAYIFQDKIISYFIEEANKELNTTIKYDKIELSLFKNFPQTSILIKNVTLIETPKGSTDTLAHFEKVYLAFNLLDIIKGDYNIKKCDVHEGFLKMKIDSLGNRNFDIVKSDTTKPSGKLKLDLQKIQLENIHYSFSDYKSAQHYNVFANDLNATLQVNNETTAVDINGNIFAYGIEVEKSAYLNNKNLSLVSNLTFDKENLNINKTDLNIENSSFSVTGMVGIGDTDTMSIQVNALEGTLKTLLSLLPGSTSDQIKDYESDGNVFFEGSIEGKRTLPSINVDFGFKNLSLTHPSLKRKITNASLTGNYNNGPKKNKSSSKLSITNVSGILDKQEFTAHLYLTNFDSPYLDFAFKGIFQLESLLSLAPDPKISKVVGNLNCDIVAKGPLKHFKNDLANHDIKASGYIDAENIGFFFRPTNSIYKDINGKFSLSNHDVKITNLTGLVGNSDFTMDGKFVRFIDFLLDYKKPLQLQATVNSKLIDLDELLSIRDTTATPTEEYRFVLSPKISIDFTTNIEKIKFDNASGGYEYKNLRGAFNIKDQIIKYNDIRINVAGGTLQLKNGTIDARQKDNITLKTNAILTKVYADSIFYLSRNFNQTFLTNRNLKGKVSGNISAALVYNSKLELLHDKINIDNHLFVEDGQLINFEPLMSLYSLMNNKTDSKIAKFLGIQAYKFFKTDNPNINSFQNLSFKPLVLNEINVRNSTIDITQIALQSSAGDINFYGNHNYNTDSINFWVDVQLKNYHKINKNRQHAEQFGNVEEDDSEGVWVYYKIFGTLDDYKYPLDWSRMMKQKKKKFWEGLKPEDQKDPDIVVPEFEEGDWMED